MNQVAPAPRKILFLITKATWGGAQRYVFDLATHLPREQFDVELAFGERGRLSALLEERGIQTIQLAAMARDISLGADLGSFFDIVALLRRTRPDVVHLNSSKAAALGALAARLVGIRRIVFTAHGWPFKEDRGPLFRIALHAASWLTVLFADVTIVVSKTDERLGTQMWVVGKKVRFVPLGIKPPQFLSRDEAWQRVREMAHVENESLPRIVSIGELTHNKGHRYAIDAIARLRDRNIAANYVIMGSGELREALEQYAIEKEVETRVYFLGFVEDASRLLKAFDIFLLPSIKEGMPYAILEAAAASVPIVSTDVVGRSNLERQVDGRFVPARDSVSLSAALELSLEEERRHAAFETSLDPMVRQTADLY